jgi:hypothetical protein
MVGGAGYYAGKKMQQGHEEDAYRDARIEELEQQQAAAAYAPPPPPPPPPVAAPAGPGPETIEQLRQLGELRQQGILTEEEFDAQKRRLLGM